MWYWANQGMSQSCKIRTLNYMVSRAVFQSFHILWHWFHVVLYTFIVNESKNILLLFHHCFILKVKNWPEQLEDVIPKFNLKNQKYQQNEELMPYVSHFTVLPLLHFPHLKQGCHKRSIGKCGQNTKTALR